MASMIIGAFWLLAGLWGSIGLTLAAWHARGATRPSATARGWWTMSLVWLAMLPAGGLFGFGLAMLLDGSFAGWGILVAATLCFAIGLASPFLWRSQRDEA